MLRTLAYIIFLCTGIFAFTLVVLFFRSQGADTSSPLKNTPEAFSIASDSKILQRIEKNYRFRSSSQDDVFGAFIFDFERDVRVADRIRMYFFENDYSLIRRNLLLLDNIYTFTDTKDFLGKTMFLNDRAGDTQIVRFITEIDGRVYGFEVLKDEYEVLKKLILQ